LGFVFFILNNISDRKLNMLPTWQWVVETGMANSLEIPQTSTVTAAIHSTQNPLADKFSIIPTLSPPAFTPPKTPLRTDSALYQHHHRRRRKIRLIEGNEKKNYLQRDFAAGVYLSEAYPLPYTL
jgi:hypothetical protein